MRGGGGPAPECDEVDVIVVDAVDPSKLSC